jgi:hypothetical protein
MAREMTAIDICDRCGVRDELHNHQETNKIRSVSYETGEHYEAFSGRDCGREKLHYDLCKKCRDYISVLIKREIEENKE